MTDDIIVLSEFTKSLNAKRTLSDEFDIFTELYDINCEIDNMINLVCQFRNDVRNATCTKEITYLFTKTRENIFQMIKDAEIDLQSIPLQYQENKNHKELIAITRGRLNEVIQSITKCY